MVLTIPVRARAWAVPAMRAPRRPAYTRSMTLPGAVITPADAGYDEARAVYNAAHDKRPVGGRPCREPR